MTRQCGKGTKRTHKGILCFIKNFQNFVGFRFPDNYNSIIALIFSPISVPLSETHMQNRLQNYLPSKEWEMVDSSLWPSFQGDLREISTPYSTVCARISERNPGETQGHAGMITPHCNGRFLKSGSKWAPRCQLNSMVWCGFGWKYLAYPFSISPEIKTVEYLQLIGSFRSGIWSRLLSSPHHYPRGRS